MGPLVTEPDARVQGALLTKAFFSGPQRFSFTDGATPDGRRLWTAARGNRNPVSCVCWTRVFRPCDHTSSSCTRSSAQIRFTPFMSDGPVRVVIAQGIP